MQPYEQLTVAKEFPVRRSELTCPAHSLKMMSKAAASEADEVILDLEDACAVSQKIPARKTLVEALNTLDFAGKLRAFRPNAVQTNYFEQDVVEVMDGAGHRVDVLVLPKVRTEEDVKVADALLTRLEKKLGLPPGRIQLEALIEGAQALLSAQAIAKASPRMASLIFGVADYAGDVGAKLAGASYDRFHYPRSHLIAAARAAGIAAIDSVTLQFRDLEQVKRDGEAGAALGFDGKWAIHPSHLPPIHGVYTPSQEELRRALAIFDAYAHADREHGVGAIVFEDEMVDAASLRVEWKKIAVGQRAGLIGLDYRLKAASPKP